MKTIALIKEYFGKDPHGRAVTTPELRELTKEERHELATLIAAELDVQLDEAA